MAALSPRLHASIAATKGEALQVIADMRVQLEKLEDDLSHDCQCPVSVDRDCFAERSMMLERALTRWIALDGLRTNFDLLPTP